MFGLGKRDVVVLISKAIKDKNEVPEGESQDL